MTISARYEIPVFFNIKFTDEHKHVFDYSATYQISGNVYHEIIVLNKQTGTIVQPTLSNTTIDQSNGNDVTTFALDRLWMYVFRGAPLNIDTTCVHINHSAADIRPCNLRWLSHKGTHKVCETATAVA